MSNEANLRSVESIQSRLDFGLDAMDPDDVERILGDCRNPDPHDSWFGRGLLLLRGRVLRTPERHLNVWRACRGPSIPPRAALQR